MAVLKQAPAARIKEVLGVLNYLAAPFGSQEATLLTYGLPDVHHTLDAQGNPILTPQGQQDVNILWTQGWAPPPVLYYPNNPRYAPTMQGDERPMLAAGITDPTVPLYSPTNGSKGGPLNQTFQDGLTDIVAGRRPFGDYDQLVSDWRSGGGEQIRAEYEQALQQTRS
jgi:putative aldouronate transport system substrate-binding protein